MNITKNTLMIAGIGIIIGAGIGMTPTAAAPQATAPLIQVTNKMPALAPTIAPRAVDTVKAAPKVITKTVTKVVPYLPPCKTEDSDNCIWDASKRGNGLGTSFIAYRGHIYSLRG